MRHSDIPKQPSNPSLPARSFHWPDGSRSCLFLSFDFDAETAWFDEDAGDWQKQVRLSHGGYGARVGVPKILELLRELSLTATFFVPAWVVEAHRGVCEAILEDGHEIGHHGTYHLPPNLQDMATSLAEIDRGFDVLNDVLGILPVGYRAPLGENSSVFLSHLADKGIRYSSSWRDDIFPYRHRIDGTNNPPVELPVNYFFDDWMYGMIKGSGRNFIAREQVLSIWADELEVSHEWGALLTTVFHPQVSGRPSRFKILRAFLQQALETDGLWIAPGRDIYEYFQQVEANA